MSKRQQLQANLSMRDFPHLQNRKRLEHQFSCVKQKRMLHGQGCWNPELFVTNKVLTVGEMMLVAAVTPAPAEAGCCCWCCCSGWTPGAAPQTPSPAQPQHHGHDNSSLSKPMRAEPKRCSEGEQASTIGGGCMPGKTAQLGPSGHANLK